MNNPRIGFTVDEMQTKGLIETVARMAGVTVTIEQVDALLDKYAMIESACPILDPTAWLQVRDNLPGHVRLARAFRSFRRELDELADQGKSEETT